MGFEAARLRKGKTDAGLSQLQLLPVPNGGSKRGMLAKDYKAVLSAVEEAIAICDRYGGRMDEARRKTCEKLRRVRAELRRQLKRPSSDSP